MALDYGIRPDEFWSYSIGEVRDVVESRQRVRLRDVKERISKNYELAELIGIHMIRLLDSKVKIPDMWEQYPKLFAEEKRQYEEQHRTEAIEEARLSRREFAAAHNRRRSGLRKKTEGR